MCSRKMSSDEILNENSERFGVKPMTEGKMELIVQYHKLASLIKDIEREVKPMYAGNRNSTETIKKGTLLSIAIGIYLYS